MSAPTVNAWVRSVDGGRLMPTIERSTHPDGASAECTDCGAGIENVTHDDAQAWVDEHDGCPAVVGLVHAAAISMRNEAILGHASTRDSRDWSEWSELPPAEQAAWFTWACGGPHPLGPRKLGDATAAEWRMALAQSEPAAVVEHHVFDRSGTVHAELVAASGAPLCTPDRTSTPGPWKAKGRTAKPVDCARCRALIDRAHIEALGIKKRAFAAYSRTPLAIRHWSKLTAGEQAAWLTWVAGDKAGPAPVLDTAADLAELQREDAYIDANRGDVAVAEVRDALDPPPVVQVPLIPDEVHQAGWVAMVAAAGRTTLDLGHVYGSVLNAIALPLYQAWVRRAVIAELDELIANPGSYTPGGWVQPGVLEARRAELAALVEQAEVSS